MNAMDVNNTLFEELFVKCETADRLSDKLCSELEKLSETERQQLVSRMNNDVTPLFIAAQRGNLDIASYLLTKCKADVNQFCKSYKENEPEMTALMVAQNVDVAHCLLEHGAEYKSTALRLHICSLRLEVADFLLSQRANINDELTKEFQSCLEYVENDPQKHELFLKYGANVNALYKYKFTPLYVAVVRNKLWQVEQLLKYGADPKNNNLQDDDDVLRLACLHRHEDVFNYLMDNVEYSDVTRANAHELIGAEYADYNIHMSMLHWIKALKIRLNNGGQFLERELREESIIKDVKEFRTMDDLRRIYNCRRSTMLQALLIDHRLCGCDHQVTLDNLYLAYKDFNEDSEFKDALHFIMRVLRHQSDSGTRETAIEAAVVIINIVENDGFEHMGIHFNDVMTVVDVLWLQLSEPMAEKDVQITIIALLFVLLKMNKSEHQVEMVKTLVTRMVHFSNNKGLSVLHKVACIKGALRIGCKRPLNNVPQRNDEDSFQLPVLQLLLKRGYHVEVLDLSRLCPLHLAVSNVCDLDLVNCVLEHEAHIDRINAVGIRRCHLMDTGHGFKTFEYVTLKCLAARTIVDHKVPYKHLTFPALDAFIEMH